MCHHTHRVMYSGTSDLGTATVRSANMVIYFPLAIVNLFHPLWPQERFYMRYMYFVLSGFSNIPQMVKTTILNTVTVLTLTYNLTSYKLNAAFKTCEKLCYVPIHIWVSL